MSTLKSAGWVVELMRCDHLDDEPGGYKWLGVNLIAPQGDTSADWTLKEEKDLAAVSRDIAKAELGDLLFPWTWQGDRQWVLFARSAAGAPWSEVGKFDVQRGVDAGHDDDVLLLRGSFHTEVDQRTSGCEHAFSMSDEAWHGQPHTTANAGVASIREQSYVHALAPPTHSPAALSNDLFQYAGFLMIPADTFDKYVSFVAFPVIKTDHGGEYLPAKAEDIEDQADAVRATYQPDASGPIALLFKSFAISGAINELADKTKAQIVEGTLAGDVVEPLFVADAMPLEILATAIAEAELKESPDWGLISAKVFPRHRWQHVLALALGSGWFPRRQSRGSSRPHILHYARTKLERQYLQQLFPGDWESIFVAPEPPPQNKNDESDAEVWLTLMRDDFKKRNADLAREDAALLEALEGLCGPTVDLPDPILEPDEFEKGVTQRIRFLRSWAHVALDSLGDRRAQVLSAWLTMRVKLHAPQDSDEALRAICGMLARVMSTDAADRLLLGTLDHAGVADIWRLLRDLARSGEDEDTENEKIKRIRQWCARTIDGMLQAVTLPKPSRTDVLLDAAMLALHSDFKGHAHRLVRRDYDEALLVRFDGAEPEDDTSTVDKLIRGYAVALRSGVVKSDGTFLPDNQNRAWVTQTSVLCYPAPAQQHLRAPQFLRAKVGQAIVETAGSTGSTRRNGRRVVQLPYRGKPVFASAIGSARPPAGSADPDEFLSLDYRLQDGARLPLLGYGSRFSGLCTALDNAGGIVDPGVRKSGAVASLEGLELVADDEWSPPNLKYVSCVPPGAPAVKALEFKDVGNASSTADVWELSDQTRAVRFVSQRLQESQKLTGDERLNAMRGTVVGGALPRVACLAWDFVADGVALYRRDRPRRFGVTISPPAATRDFVNCWLATDRLEWITQNKNFSDSNFDVRDKFEEFADKYLNDRSPQRDYHPAVTAIGIEFAFGDQFDTGAFYLTVPLTRTAKDANGNLGVKGEDVHIEIAVQAALDRPSEPELVSGQTHRVSISIPPGCYVRLRCYTLVENRFFDSTDSLQRFYKDLPKADVGAFAAHRSFGPLEYWVESLPRWQQVPLPSSEYFPIEVAGPAAPSSDLQRLLFTPGNLSAEWIRAVEIRRHSWHWTGYPVRFPSWDRGDQLMQWLPTFAGVESNREILTLELPTRVVARDWKFGLEDPAAWSVNTGDLVLHEHRMRSGERPSQYAAYTVKAVVRFASWLDPAQPPNQGWPRDLERDIFAAGNAIQGVGAFGETQRLPAPAFQFHIPLTATYQYDPSESYAGLPLGRSVNGNLLIFGDAIRRTDSFARSGGIGDTIEVDLLRTRHVDSVGSDFSQLGPNPIFHAAPAASGELPKNFQDRVLKVSEPHGLTYDLVRNAKVAQTAILVQPAMCNPADEQNPSVDNVPNEWLLAQVRVRRLILPETQVNAMVRASDAEPLEFPLPWRAEGMDRVPYDFALDVVPRAGLSVALKAIADDGSLDTYSLEIPGDLPVDRRVRLLVSFHKGRWDPTQPPEPLTGLPYWAPQVHAQVMNSATLGWATIRKLTCHKKKAWLARAGKLKLSVAGATEPCAYTVQLSDYTDARWLLFMGRVPGTGKRLPEEYLFTPRIEDKVVKLTLTRGAFGILVPPPVVNEDNPEPWRAKAVEFFVLFVSAPGADIIGGVSGQEDFGLLTFRPLPDHAGKRTVEFVQMGGAEITDPSQLRDAVAVLCSFQRINSPSAKERKVSIDTFGDLLDAMFPDYAADEWRERECLVRPTGSHWGPMVIRT